ncbi:hypothetical protein ABZ175_35415, partial [Streptomyces cyaneofuscatus]
WTDRTGVVGSEQPLAHDRIQEFSPLRNPLPRDELVAGVSATWMAQARATSIVIIPVVIDGKTVALAAASCLGNPPPGRDRRAPGRRRNPRYPGTAGALTPRHDTARRPGERVPLP